MSISEAPQKKSHNIQFEHLEVNKNNQLSYIKELVVKKTNRYKRFDSLDIIPVIDYSSSEEEGNNDLSTNVNILPKICKISKSKREMRKRVKVRWKKQVGRGKLENDRQAEWGLPEECLAISKQHKKESYQELYDKIMEHIEGRWRKRAIFLSGERESGKKTLVLEVIKQVRAVSEVLFQEYFLSFEQKIDNNLKSKIGELYQFLRGSELVESRQIGENKLQNIIVIDCYKAFILTVRQSSLRHYFRSLMLANTTNLLIFIDNNITRKHIEMLTSEYCDTVSMLPNTKDYFLHSLLTTINSYSFTHQAWELPRPLASFFSTKMQEKKLLHLCIIRKFVNFLQNEGLQLGGDSGSEKQRVSRELIGRFMDSVSDRVARVELGRLTTHEKGVMVGCYLCLKEEPQVLVTVEEVYKRYCWICQSLSMRTKSLKELKAEAIYQLEAYKLIRVQKREGLTAFLLKVDLLMIENELSQDFPFHKFFPKD